MGSSDTALAHVLRPDRYIAAVIPATASHGRRGIPFFSRGIALAIVVSEEGTGAGVIVTFGDIVVPGADPVRFAAAAALAFVAGI